MKRRNPFKKGDRVRPKPGGALDGIRREGEVMGNPHWPDQLTVRWDKNKFGRTYHVSDITRSNGESK